MSLDKMKHIQLLIHLSEDLVLKSVEIEYNDTGHPDDSKLLEMVAYTLLKALKRNKEDIKVQDLLNELKIERTPNQS